MLGHQSGCIGHPLGPKFIFFMSTLLGSGSIYGRDKNKRQLPCHSGLTITGWLVANENRGNYNAI